MNYQGSPHFNTIFFFFKFVLYCVQEAQQAHKQNSISYKQKQTENITGRLSTFKHEKFTYHFIKMLFIDYPILVQFNNKF